MAKNLRRGKIFIDWSQNSDFKTTIGVYSLRANHPEPFVSAPVLGGVALRKSTCPGVRSIPPPRPTGESSSSRTARAESLLKNCERVISGRGKFPHARVRVHGRVRHLSTGSP